MALEHGLSITTVAALHAVFKLHAKIKSVILYGSRAKGTFKIGSDIDLTLIAPDLTLTDLLKIENEIDDHLLPYKTDLSLYHQIENPELLQHIQRIGKIFYTL